MNTKNNDKLKFLCDLGYCIEKNTDKPGLWIWMSPTDNSLIEFKTVDEATTNAWQDAVEQTMAINNLSSEQWDKLSYSQQKTQIEDAFLEDLKDDQITDTKSGSNENLISIDLNIFDNEGNVVDGTTSRLTRDQISDIIDHASQLILIHRSGQNIESVLADLEEALTTANVIDDECQNEAHKITDC